VLDVTRGSELKHLCSYSGKGCGSRALEKAKGPNATFPVDRSDKSGEKTMVEKDVNSTEKSHVKRKKVKKVWKPRSSGRKMVLGNDIGLQDVTKMEICALVGCFTYWAMKQTDIGWWVESSWS
jgi:hypothetical protein